MECTGYPVPVSRISGRYYYLAEILNGTGYHTVSVSYRSFVSTNWRSHKHLLCIAMCNNSI